MAELDTRATLKEISVKPYGDLIELGIAGDKVAVLVELTTDQADELAKLLRAVRKEILRDP
jgi:hypothetical protein